MKKNEPPKHFPFNVISFLFFQTLLLQTCKQSLSVGSLKKTIDDAGVK